MNSRKNEKKHKLIKKGKESTVIEFNLSKAVIWLIIIGAIIAGIVTKEIVTTIIETNQRELLANDETDLQSTRSINGDLGYINSVDLKEVKTGIRRQWDSTFIWPNNLDISTKLCIKKSRRRSKFNRRSNKNNSRFTRRIGWNSRMGYRVNEMAK